MQPWKSCTRDGDLSDSGSVQKSTGQGLELPEETGKFGLLGAEAEDFQWSLPTFVILGCTETHGPLSSHQKARPWKATAVQDCTEVLVVLVMVLKCVEMPLMKAELLEK